MSFWDAADACDRYLIGEVIRGNLLHIYSFCNLHIFNRLHMVCIYLLRLQYSSTVYTFYKEIKAIYWYNVFYIYFHFCIIDKHLNTCNGTKANKTNYPFLYISVIPTIGSLILNYRSKIHTY